ncbi:MAG TPA: hypothetical protein VKX46_01445 [Ktedonobacteraceae bacterium]|jgi:uncharacterized cupredoxin-like copper-binding protein|nr:hypothetical protein [Ktedonobacteraceae bacterium]
MNKRYGAGVLLMFCVALLAACGNASQARTSQTNMPWMSRSTDQANTSSGQITASAIPASTNTVQANTSITKAVDVHITLADFRITSSLLTFRAGVPYHFIVTNVGQVAHELMLMSTTMKTMPMDGIPMKNMDQMALADLEAMTPGTTKTFTYAFVLATAGPHPEFSCHLPGHYKAGMHLDVTITS